MGDSHHTDLEVEAERTVDGLLDHCDVPPGVAREARRLRGRDDTLEALDGFLRNTRAGGARFEVTGVEWC